MVRPPSAGSPLLPDQAGEGQIPGPRAGHLEPAEVVQLPGEVQGHPVQVVEARPAVTVPVHRNVAADVDERTPAGDLVDPCSRW